MRGFETIHHIAYAQANNCLLCLHIGRTAVYFGWVPGLVGLRVELFTPLCRFRVSWPGWEN